MEDEVSGQDIDIILESLNHYKLHIENYQGYPSYDFKQQQMKRVESTIAKVRTMKRKMPGNPA